jgi:hypothetical protein
MKHFADVVRLILCFFTGVSLLADLFDQAITQLENMLKRHFHLSQLDSLVSLHTSRGDQGQAFFLG